VNESVHVPHGDEMRRKYVFVGGPQRSGTSNVARLENCTGFKNTGVLEDEGQYLQDVYPTDWAYGGPGRYGFDARRPPDGDFRFIDARERRQTLPELACLLGQNFLKLLVIESLSV